MPGFELHTLWAALPPPRYSDAPDAAASMTWFPPVGGVRFFHMVLPPDGGVLEQPEDPESAMAEMEAKVPGLLATMDPDDPGMHRSETIDCLYVLSGHPALELDDGKEVSLSPGDVVVQRGTRHRWHNRGRESARFLGVLVGATGQT